MGWGSASPLADTVWLWSQFCSLVCPSHGHWWRRRQQRGLESWFEGKILCLTVSRRKIFHLFYFHFVFFKNRILQGEKMLYYVNKRRQMSSRESKNISISTQLRKSRPTLIKKINKNQRNTDWNQICLTKDWLSAGSTCQLTADSKRLPLSAAVQLGLLRFDFYFLLLFFLIIWVITGQNESQCFLCDAWRTFERHGTSQIRAAWPLACNLPFFLVSLQQAKI